MLLPSNNKVNNKVRNNRPGISLSPVVARNETKYEKILHAADFARRENCFSIRLNDAFRKTLLKAAKKSGRQPTMRAEFSLIRALISN